MLRRLWVCLKNFSLNLYGKIIRARSRKENVYGSVTFHCFEIIKLFHFFIAKRREAEVGWMIAFETVGFLWIVKCNGKWY